MTTQAKEKTEGEGEGEAGGQTSARGEGSSPLGKSREDTELHVGAVRGG